MTKEELIDEIKQQTEIIIDLVETHRQDMKIESDVLSKMLDDLVEKENDTK